VGGGRAPPPPAPLRPCATTSWGHLSKVHTQIWSLGTSTLLAATAFALAALSFMFPLYLQAHAASDGFGLPNAVAETLIPVLMFLLAAVVGMQFPLAVAIESGCGAASRVYTADFVGASLGAFVTGACTIPMFGVGKTCILAGALNAAAGMALLLRRKTS